MPALYDPTPRGTPLESMNETHMAAQKPLYLCHPFVRSALIKGSFRTIVALPKYVHPYEWIAMNCTLCAHQCLTSSTI